jgi:hypothetical protein
MKIRCTVVIPALFAALSLTALVVATAALSTASTVAAEAAPAISQPRRDAVPCVRPSGGLGCKNDAPRAGGENVRVA